MSDDPNKPGEGQPPAPQPPPPPAPPAPKPEPAGMSPAQFNELKQQLDAERKAREALEATVQQQRAEAERKAKLEAFESAVGAQWADKVYRSLVDLDKVNLEDSTAVAEYASEFRKNHPSLFQKGRSNVNTPYPSAGINQEPASKLEQIAKNPAMLKDLDRFEKDSLFTQAFNMLNNRY